MSTILPHMVCGLSVNLECMSEMCCTLLAENTGLKNSPKIVRLSTRRRLFVVGTSPPVLDVVGTRRRRRSAINAVAVVVGLPLRHQRP